MCLLRQQHGTTWPFEPNDFGHNSTPFGDEVLQPVAPQLRHALDQLTVEMPTPCAACEHSGSEEQMVAVVVGEGQLDKSLHAKPPRCPRHMSETCPRHVQAATQVCPMVRSRSPRRQQYGGSAREKDLMEELQGTKDELQNPRVLR